MRETAKTKVVDRSRSNSESSTDEPKKILADPTHKRPQMHMESLVQKRYEVDSDG